MFYVSIVADETGEPVKVMGPMSWNSSEKVVRGASINLNHREYSVSVTSKENLPDGWIEKAEA